MATTIFKSKIAGVKKKILDVNVKVSRFVGNTKNEEADH